MLLVKSSTDTLDRQKDERVLEQIKPETSLEAKMTILRLSCFGHIMRRRDSLEKRKTKYEMD